MGSHHLGPQMPASPNIFMDVIFVLALLVKHALVTSTHLWTLGTLSTTAHIHTP